MKNPALKNEYPAGTALFDDGQILFDKAYGNYLTDTRGRQYTDLCMGFGSLPLGHNHPEIVSTIESALSDRRILTSMSDVYASQAKSQLIQRISSLLPQGLDQIGLCVTGSDAVELALKTAALATQKPGVLALTGGYHGLSLATTYLTGISKFRAPFPDSWAPSHIRYVEPEVDMAQIQKILADSQDSPTAIGQMIVEPILGRSGVQELSISWLRELKETLASNGCLLIYDEVYTGFGRAGRMFQAEIIQPDILCLAKALGGGMPMACIASTPEILSHWPQNTGEALHTGTYFGHGLSCLVADKTLEIIERDNLSARAHDLGLKLKRFLKASEALKEARVVGLMCALDLGYDGKGVQLANTLRAKGIIAVAGGASGECLNIIPALNICEDLLFETMEVIMKTTNEDKK